MSLRPKAIFKYINEEIIDSNTGDIHYIVRIWYDTEFQRIKYTYERAGLKEANGRYTLKKLENLPIKEEGDKNMQ